MFSQDTIQELREQVDEQQALLEQYRDALDRLRAEDGEANHTQLNDGSWVKGSVGEIADTALQGKYFQ